MCCWALEHFLPLLSNRAFVKPRHVLLCVVHVLRRNLPPVCDSGALCGIVNTHGAAQALPSVHIIQTAPSTRKATR